MKRLFLLSIIISLVLSLTACGINDCDDVADYFDEDLYVVRELEEEMNYTFDKTKFVQAKVFENFFEYDGKKFHEIYFLYEYVLSETEYENIKITGTNKDNSTTHFEFVSKFDMKKYNVLPLELHPIIEK